MASEWFKQELKYLSFCFVISIVASVAAVITLWDSQNEPGFDYNLVSLLRVMWPSYLIPWFCAFLFLSGGENSFYLIVEIPRPLEVMTTTFSNTRSPAASPSHSV